MCSTVCHHYSHPGSNHLRQHYFFVRHLHLLCLINEAERHEVKPFAGTQKQNKFRLIKFYIFLSSFSPGDLMDVLALINSAINFILYCSMSRQFRNTFNYLFRPKFLDKWLPVPQNDDGTPGGRRNQEGATTQITQV